MKYLFFIWNIIPTYFVTSINIENKNFSSILNYRRKILHAKWCLQKKSIAEVYVAIFKNHKF